MSEIVNSSLKSTVTGTSDVFLGMVASILLWFVTKVLIVRNTTKEELGIYSIVVAVAGMVSVFACLGIQEGVPRSIAVFLGEGRDEGAHSISRTAIRTGLASGTIFFLLLALFAGTISRHFFYKPELETPLLVISGFIPCSVFASIVAGILRGHRIIYPKVFFLDIGQPLLFLAFICLFMFLHLKFLGIIAAYTMAMAMVAVVMAAFFFNRTSGGGPPRKGEKYDMELIKFSAPLLITGILGMVLAWSDTLMLGRYTLAEEVGLYSVSISLAKLLAFPLGAMVFIYLPIAGQMYAKGQMAELKKTYQVLTKWNFAVTLPIFFILFFFPEMTISFFFGSRFVDSTTSLRILSICFLFHAFLGANGVLMITLGRAKELMNISIFGTALNVVLNWVLIKHAGMGNVGAAVATLVSYFALNVLVSVILYKASGIHPLTSKYLRPIAASMVVAAILYATAKSLPLSFWMMPLYLALFLGGYVLSLLMTGSLDKEDLFLFDAISGGTGLELKRTRQIIDRFVSK